MIFNRKTKRKQIRDENFKFIKTNFHSKKFSSIHQKFHVFFEFQMKFSILKKIFFSKSGLECHRSPFLIISIRLHDILYDLTNIPCADWILFLFSVLVQTTEVVWKNICCILNIFILRE